MLSFKIRKVKIGISFSFFAVIALMCLWQGSEVNNLLVMLMCCFIHEIGHVIAMCICNVPPKEIIAYGGGIKIYPNSTKMNSDNQDIFILSAGCMINILLSCLLLVLNRFSTYFAMANLFLGLFNLIPVKYFDGGRILSVALKDSKLIDVIRLVFIVFFGIVIAGMIYNGIFSISLFVIYAYILISEFFS